MNTAINTTTEHGEFLDMRVDEALYYFAYAVYFIQCALSRTCFTKFLFIPVEVFSSFTQLVVLLLLFLKFLMQRASFRCWALSAFIVLIGFGSWRQSGEGWLFWAALFIVCANGVGLRPLAKITFAFSLATLAVTMTSAQLGVIENWVSTRDGVVRYCMGFIHPNVVGRYLLCVCVAFSVMRFGKNPVPDLALIGIAVALNLTIANSRTSALLLLLQAALLLVFFFVRNEVTRSIFRRCFAVVLLLIIAASFYFMAVYTPSNTFLAILNKLLSGRLSLAHSYYVMQPLTLMGSTFEGFAPIYWNLQGEATFCVDNGWCHLVIRYGIVPATLFLLGYLALFFKLINHRKWDALLFGLFMMGIYGFSETVGIRVECNFFLFAVGADLLYSGRLFKGVAPGVRSRGESEIGAANASSAGSQAMRQVS